MELHISQIQHGHQPFEIGILMLFKKIIEFTFF
jgi:hypothetical protein